jgi:hypothetical protein
MSHLTLLLLITGAGQADAAGTPPPRPPRPPGSNMVRPHSPLSPAERAAAPLSAQWLVGDWTMFGCGPEPDTAIFPDGTYRMADGGGHWTLAGSRLTMRLERLPSVEIFGLRLGEGGVSRIRKIGPDEIAVRWPGAPESRFVRCS